MIVNKYTKGCGGGSGSTEGFWTSAQTEEHIESAASIVYGSATTYTDQAISGIDLSAYYTSAQTEEAITSKNYITSGALEDYALSADVESLSAATMGKADAQNVTANPDGMWFPKWNSQGIITGQKGPTNFYDVYFYLNGNNLGKTILTSANGFWSGFYAPTEPGNAGEILVSSGRGNAPVWSAVTIPDAKTVVNFDVTPQSERASIYAELKALYDGGSGATINKLYDFYKTVNTWQGQKIDYYTFSGGTLVFGKVVSPENVTDQVVYEQVVEIDAAGNVNVVTNTVGGGGVSPADFATLSAKVQTNEEVLAGAIVDLNGRVVELSGTTPDLSNYATTGTVATLSGAVQSLSAATSSLSGAVNTLSAATQYMVTSTTVTTIWKGTQSEYDALTNSGATADASTFYIIMPTQG